jgi:hypothetical protein
MSDLLEPTHDIYVSGPMSGHPDLNVPAFEEATERLRALGRTVISPHEFIQNQGEHAELTGPEARARFLRYDVVQVAQVRKLAMLDGWEQSVGANIELAVARMLGIPAVEYSTGHAEIGPDWVLILEHIGDLSDAGMFKVEGATDGTT